MSDEILRGTSWRVATWNLHGMRGGVHEIASVIHAEEVDILLLQESGPRRRLRALGETLGMVVCADPRAFPRRRIQNAVLVRGGRAAIVHNRLRRFSGGSHLYPRGVLVADVDERFSVMSVHLGLSGTERAHHVAQLMEMIEGSSGSFVIGADLNALPGDPGPASLADAGIGLLGGRGRWVGGNVPLARAHGAHRLSVRRTGGAASPRVDRGRHGFRPSDGRGGARDHGDGGGRGDRPGFLKSWIAMYSPKRVTATTRNDRSPRKNHSRKPLIASTLASYRAGIGGPFGRVATCASGSSPAGVIARD